MPSGSEPGGNRYGEPLSLQSTVLPGADAEQATLDGLASERDAPRVPTSDLVATARVDRFVLVRRIGAGAMGLVWVAYDEVLDRRVAIKFVRPDRAITVTDRTRLLREARAMARLSHPNVVQVYDAGDENGRVFVAMEFVAGRTLRDWMNEPAARGWRAVVEMFRGIASGLVAAHACGIVHRDFKPENVMIGGDERPKVADFGLADLGMPNDTATDEGHSQDATAEITATGAIVGTPAYMAPELHRGESADAASDQFAFCIALWEALHGERPFAAANLPALVVAVCEGRRAAPVRAVPPWLQRVVERGLATDARRRWPSMAALRRELERDRTRTRNHVVGVGIVAAGAAALAIAMRTPDPCTGAAERLASSWDAEQRERLATAFVEVGSPFADDTWRRIAPRIDDWTDAWVHAHEDACAATLVHHEQSPAALDLRMACLQRAQQSLDGVTSVLADADADALAHADEIVEGLDDLDRCRDVLALQADVEPPEESEREAVRAARAALAEAVALRRAGRLDGARAAIVAVDGHLHGIAYEPVRSEMVLERALLEHDLDDESAAEASARLALESALRSHQPELARRAVLLLMKVVGHELDRPVPAMMLVDVASGLSGASAKHQADLAHATGAVRMGAGEYAAAVESFTAALAAHEGDEHPSTRDIVAARIALATALSKAGRLDEARHAYDSSLAQLERDYGPKHPYVAQTHESLARLFILQGQPAAAEAELRTALAILGETVGDAAELTTSTRQSLAVAFLRSNRASEAEVELRAVIEARTRALGPDHAKVGLTRGTLGFVLQELGRLEEAAEEIDRAIAISSRALGPRHPDVIGMHNNYGSLLHALRRDEEALAEHRACAEARLAVLGPDHHDTATSHFNIAVVALALGRAAEAEVETGIALPVFRAALGDDHRLVYATLSLRGMALADLGRTQEALVALEAAWKGQDRPEVAPRKAADTASELAEVLWNAGDDRPRARALATRAIELYTTAGESGDRGRKQTQEWLRTH